MALGLLLVVGVITGGWVWLNGRQTVSPARAYFESVSAFQPYYFANDTPPMGLLLAEDSLTYDNGIFIFTLTDEHSERISITQQAVPELFANTVPEGSEKIETAYGQAALSLIQDRTVVSLIANHNEQRTFILVNASSRASLDQVKTVIRSLEPVAR